MIKTIKKVLTRLIISKYPEISNVEVSNQNKGEYKVTYLIIDSINYNDAYDIIIETETLFKLIQSNQDDTVIVSFGKDNSTSNQ